eukprot:CAMPEP_0182456482 /NCGR_PEP_ID=MMETSP1319-20130603/2306_1 /TAXON_ID=172717 /ORGANISM="Bolidomonas pacifica, Strain RCC208" /LENGTH=93 /DNA_ID=CAMNT_0024654739 /DNA_START=202 /DNA_END=483 /DNA_ORIENTATION=+
MPMYPVFTSISTGRDTLRPERAEASPPPAVGGGGGGAGPSTNVLSTLQMQHPTQSYSSLSSASDPGGPSPARPSAPGLFLNANQQQSPNFSTK